MTTDQPLPYRENPRTTRVRQIILDAAISLLIRDGAGAVTAVRIAEETNVARTTIYRYWPSPAVLLLDAIDRIVSPHVPTSITDDLAADLTTALSNLRKRMTRRKFRTIFAALLNHANHNQEFVAAQRRFVNGVLQPIHDILSAAIVRDDLSSTVDVEMASVQIAGPLFLQHVMLRTPVSDGLIAQSVRQFLRGADESG